MFYSSHSDSQNVVAHSDFIGTFHLLHCKHLTINFSNLLFSRLLGNERREEAQRESL